MSRGRSAWIGGHQSGSSFTWLDGSAWNFENWQSPIQLKENNESRNCIQLGSGYNFGVWKRVSCEEHQIGHICQKKKVSSGLFLNNFV